MKTNGEPRATRGRSWSRSNRLLLAGIVAAMAAVSLVAQVALAGAPSPTVDPKIRVGEGNKVFLVGHATGVQIYTCNGAVWSAAVPRASLYGDNGKLIISHFAGPTWQAKDGSQVLGKLVDKIIVDRTAIPWLLLSATTTPGADGDRLVDTTFIQRISTTGGLTPPAADCNAATAGTGGGGPHTAHYFFLEHTSALPRHPLRDSNNPATRAASFSGNPPAPCPRAPVRIQTAPARCRGGGHPRAPPPTSRIFSRSAAPTPEPPTPPRASTSPSRGTRRRRTASCR